MSTHEDRIRQRAYEIWEREGRPHGDDLKHWMQAFQEIAENAQPSTLKPARATKMTTSSPDAKTATTGKIKKEKSSASAAPSQPVVSGGAKPARGVTTH
jgi:hypothetical protein